MNLPVYNQLDPRWKDVVIGLGSSGPLTIGSHGCLISCEAMRLAAYGLAETPATVVAKAKITGGVLDIEGNLAWAGMERVYPTIAFLERRFTVNRQADTVDGSPKVQAQASIDRIKLLLSMGQPVPLEVFVPSQHFVLAVKWDDVKQDFLCHDPNGGISVWFRDRYGDPMTKLMGWIADVGPSAWYPEGSSLERQQMGLSLGYAQLAARGKETRANALRSAESLVR